MDALATTAASGMRARMESLDILANNLANASAAGFKADREFYSTYVSARTLDANETAGDLSAQSPVTEQRWIDFSQGALTPTGNGLDLALEGEGFFVAQSPLGPLYTRSGDFHIDTRGVLVTRNGEAVEDGEGNPIHLDASQPIEVSPSGQILQNQVPAAQLKLVRFTSPQALSKQGNNAFQLSASALVPIPSSATVHQGSVESGNVQPAETAVRLVSVMRQFEMLQKAMSLGNQMNEQAIQNVAKAAA